MRKHLLASTNLGSRLCSRLNPLRNRCSEIKSVVLLIAVFSGLFAVVNATFAQTWTETSEGDEDWVSVASSADGMRLVAAAYAGPIETSTNSGATWMTDNAPPLANWASVVSSADGTKLVAVAHDQNNFSVIYTSTDSGTTWTERTTFTNEWLCLASSADGTELISGTWNHLTYMSTNSGLTWNIQNVPNGDMIVGVACSTNAKTLVVVTSQGFVYTSTNSGATWNSASIPILQAYCVAVSADGTKMIASGDITFTPEQGSPVL
ncbi:MAG: hypothetical protein ABSF38_06735 [Verrucomicrobiota bacterium]|jgi:photosystem II stability/assembly factor-like uncharacterized protein